jgi:hypothetical protein
MSYYISTAACGDIVPNHFITVAKNNDPMPESVYDCGGVGLDWKPVPDDGPSYPTSSRDTQIRPPSNVPSVDTLYPNLNGTETVRTSQKSTSEFDHGTVQKSEPKSSVEYTYRDTMDTETYGGRAESIYRNSCRVSGPNFFFLLNLLLL